MIWQPKLGQAVRLHYGPALRAQTCIPHGRVGVVVCVARGPGPRNVEVLLPNGQRVAVPRGNLVRIEP